MDDGGHHENGRRDSDQYKQPLQGHQWFMQQQQQPSTKHIIGVMAERDAAIQERNIAISEKKAAMAERDMAYLQRDKAIQERNAAVIERDSALAALHYRETSTPMNGDEVLPSHHHNNHHQLQMVQIPYPCRDVQVGDVAPISSIPSGKKKKKKRKGEEEKMKGMVAGKVQDWGEESGLGLNRIGLDESMMVPPVCTCTGVMRQCYKWGNGGWQSSCCTTSISVYPLPAMPNKRHTRIGGRKMSGSAFSKLLTRLAADGFDPSSPVDLKDHWAKHGTNRYITIK